MKKSLFEISKMDCPSEENLIRMKLDGISDIAELDFDIPNRKLTVFHYGEVEKIEKSISDLKLGDRRISTEKSDRIDFDKKSDQKRLLWVVLAINFAFFQLLPPSIDTLTSFEQRQIHTQTHIHLL